MVSACFSYPDLKNTPNEAASGRDWSLVVDSTLLKFISGCGSYTYSVSAVLYMRVVDKGMCFIYRCHLKITVVLSCFAVVCFLSLLHGVLWSWTWFHIMQDQGCISRCRSNVTVTDWHIASPMYYICTYQCFWDFGCSCIVLLWVLTLVCIYSQQPSGVWLQSNLSSSALWVS